MNLNTKKNVRFVSSISSSVNLWTYQGFFLVAFKFYTFGSWFFHNHWVGVCYLYTFNSRFIYKRWVVVFYQNSDFSFLGQVIQYCLLGLKACLLRIASLSLLFYMLINSRIESRNSWPDLPLQWHALLSRIMYVKPMW